MSDLIVSQAVDVTEAGEPSVGFNIGGPPSYYSEFAFLDIFKQRQGSWSQNSSITGTDSNGDVTGLADVGANYWFAFFAEGHTGTGHRSGNYKLTWEGEPGVVSLSGVTGANYSTPNVVTFYLNATTFDNRICTVTPSDWGDYPRNFRCIRTDHQAAYDAGELYWPEFLTLQENVPMMRFMDWGATNSSTVVDWADRIPLSYSTWIHAVPWEIQIDLCNRFKAQPWFCIPHNATSDYITQAATLVRDTLDPDIIPIFELSNELWNSAFSQHNEYNAESLAAWGVEWQSRDWYAKKSTEMSQIVRGIITNVRTVMSWQQVSPTSDLVTAPVWEAQEPGNYVAPYTLHDAITTTFYYGAALAANDTEIMAALDVSQEAALDLMYPLVGYDGTLDNVSSWRSVSVAYDLKTYFYEGNQHIELQELKGTAFWDGNDPADGVVDLLEAFNYSEEMGQNTSAVLDGIKARGCEAMAFYLQMRPHSQYGSYGIVRHYNDPNPIQTAVETWSAANPIWWLK